MISIDWLIDWLRWGYGAPFYDIHSFFAFSPPYVSHSNQNLQHYVVHSLQLTTLEYNHISSPVSISCIFAHGFGKQHMFYEVGELFIQSEEQQ